MEELLKKLSTYHIFNYLLPGTLFAGFGSSTTSLNLIHDNLLIAVFLYYFYGLVISRLGSIILEPILKFVRFVRFSEYPDHVAATEKDELLPELSETNNMYRTLSMLFLCLMLLKILDINELLGGLTPTYLLGAMFLLFVFAYRKQTAFIVKRVNRHSESP